MKKALALTLCACMAIGLASCGGSGNSQSAGSTAASGSAAGSSGDTSLSMIWWGNQARNERTQGALELYMEQNPGVTIDGQFAEWDDYWNKLATVSAGHNLPDVIQMDYAYLSQYISNGLLVDLSPYIESGVLDVSGIDPGILESGSQDGAVYAICNGVNAPAMVYNKTLLDENGITVKDNMTVDEFVALSKEIYEKTGVKTGFAYGEQDYFLEYLVRAGGQTLYSADGSGFGVDSADAFVPFFEFYENGIAEGWMLGPEVYADRMTGSIEQSAMIVGNSPEQMSWCSMAYSNQVVAFQEAADAVDIEVGVTTWPSPDPTKSNYLKPSQFFCVTVDSENPEEAAKLLDFFTNSLACNEILLAERGIPAASEVAQALTPKLSEVEQRASDFVNDVVTPNCSPISPPAPENAAEVLDLCDQLQEQVCYGQMTAQDAAQQLFEQGSAILAG